MFSSRRRLAERHATSFHGGVARRLKRNLPQGGPKHLSVPGKPSTRNAAAPFLSRCWNGSRRDTRALRKARAPPLENSPKIYFTGATRSCSRRDVTLRSYLCVNDTNFGLGSKRPGVRSGFSKAFFQAGREAAYEDCDQGNPRTAAGKCFLTAGAVHT
jgi:hypothetical protein